MLVGVLMIGGATLRLSDQRGPVIHCQRGKDDKAQFHLPGGAKAAFKWVEDHLPEADQPAGNAIVEFYMNAARSARS